MRSGHSIAPEAGACEAATHKTLDRQVKPGHEEATMRPSLLNPLFASASGLKGIGPKFDNALVRLLRPNAGHGATARLIDLLFHLPTGTVDRRRRCRIAELPGEGIVTIEVTVGRHRPQPRRAPRAPYRIDCFDQTGTLSLVYFNAHADQLRRLLPEGETRFVSGRVEWYGGSPQIVHPDHVVTPAAFERMPLVEPLYPLSAGVPGRVLARAVASALDQMPALPEWQDPAWLAARGWPSLREALLAIHRPAQPDSAGSQSPARLRLAYDELLANQLALALVRAHMRRKGGRAIVGDGRLARRILAALPYRLTRAQAIAIDEIRAGLAAPQRMIRLLQGDVGSGKTVVALLAMAACAEAGCQAAMMAPTDILARQHFEGLKPLALASGITLDLLTGRDKGQGREDILERLASGRTTIAIGTHAMFQESVGFHDLGLAVIDEQHRFGVHQRLALQAKAGQGANLLVMTATPIPRTLALTLYGDMDVSRLTEKPAGRQPVDTRTMPLERLGEVVDRLAAAIAQGGRAYWVCPLVEESELVDEAAAVERHAALVARFGDRVGLVHGRMKGDDKDAVMRRFQSGDIAILVSTTVIEVGVDVPDATIMIVENAERFGLAQLHQLRGRVGRGPGRSACVLIYKGPLGDTAKARLSIMRETEDGFRIAEEDLRLRGSGEVLGTRQAGMPAFRLADLAEHGELLSAARDDVELVLARDPKLASRRGEALRHLLYLFERDEAIRLLSAG
jgi:ATP-dependent DNA helicase RecG